MLRLYLLLPQHGRMLVGAGRPPPSRGAPVLGAVTGRSGSISHGLVAALLRVPLAGYPVSLPVSPPAAVRIPTPGGSASRRSRGRLVSLGVGMCALCKSEQLSNTTSDQIGTDQIHIDVKQRWAALSLEQLRAVRLVLILATPLMRCGFPTGL